MNVDSHITVVGAGIAGTEAAWQLARRGIRVTLVEMRPTRMPPAHHTDQFAELVCSNSFKGTDPASAAGLIKHELGALGSVVLKAAHECRVPAGAALAVDREQFSGALTELISNEPLIRVERAEQTDLPPSPCIIATGPLTSEGFEPALSRLVGQDRLSFYDAAAPIVEAATIDREIAFAASRYGKGEGADYLNCPMNRKEYECFISALLDAKRVVDKSFERMDLFQACQPVEQIASTGPDALRFGALKPVGLTDPRTGERPHAVVQLRAETAAGTAYNLVGFQTNLRFGEQQRVFRLIPGLQNAEFLRYGVMHRNTYVDAPRILTPSLEIRTSPRYWIAGQLAGTEGYLEAAATGLLAALSVWASEAGLEPAVLPPTTAIGSLLAYATDPDTARYQPMHVNFGLMPPLAQKVRGKKERYAAYAQRAHRDLAEWMSQRPDLGLADAG